MATTPYRITPNLGPALTASSADNYWDDIAPSVDEPSYQLGSAVTGNDGKVYTYLKAHTALAEGDEVAIASSGKDSEAGTGYAAAVAVASGDAFHAVAVAAPA